MRAEQFKELLHDPQMRDPRGFILPSDQADFPTATKFINTLIKAGVTVERATRQFTVAGKRYPAGSYVVKSAQAFRPHVMDMFEPQDHPDDIPYPGGPPTPPYDATGYTLAFQMGVQVRPDPRRFRWPVREGDRTAGTGARQGERQRQRRPADVLPESRLEQRLHRRQPSPCRGRAGQLGAGRCARR